MDDLFPMVSVLLACVFIVWMTLARQAKQVQAQAAEVMAGLEQDVPQSRTTANIGIAVATLESVLIHLRAALTQGETDPELLSRDLLAAQSQLHEVRMQVEDLLPDLPEADAILDVLARAPSLAGGPGWSAPEAAETMELVRTSVREAHAYLEVARARVQAEEEALRAERAQAARIEAEALEAARAAGTLPASTGRKERT